MGTRIKSFEVRAIDDALGRLRRRFGYGWQSLGPELRQALLRSEVLGTLNGIIDMPGSHPESLLKHVAAVMQEAVMYDGETRS